MNRLYIKRLRHGQAEFVAQMQISLTFKKKKKKKVIYDVNISKEKIKIINKKNF